MDTLKLNRILYLAFVLILFSCEKTVVKYYTNDDCETYVSSKKGFWIDVPSDSLKNEDIIFQFGAKRVIPQKKELVVGSINFFINENLKLNDTLLITYNKKNYKLYGFTNIKETVIDGSNHENIEICRVSTAKLNGKIIQDSRNNILNVILD